MKRYNNFLKLFVITCIICFALNVMAHDAWVEPGDGPVYKILYGHKIPEPYNVDKVTSLKVFDMNEKDIPYERIKTNEGLSIKVTKAKPAMFVLNFDNGYWITKDGKSANVDKSKISNSDSSSHPYKYSKTILSWQPWMAKAFGQRLEFIPVNVLHMPKPGEQLKLQLLFDGKPLSEQMIENNSNEQGPKTDADGYATVTVVKGANRFATDYDIMNSNNENVKRVSLTAVLAFNAQ